MLMCKNHRVNNPLFIHSEKDVEDALQKSLDLKSSLVSSCQSYVVWSPKGFRGKSFQIGKLALRKTRCQEDPWSNCRLSGGRRVTAGAAE